MYIKLAEKLHGNCNIAALLNVTVPVLLLAIKTAVIIWNDFENS